MINNIAKITRHGQSFKIIQECVSDENAKLFSYSQDPYGAVMMFVIADSWEQAFESARDELPCVNEYWECYGFQSKAECDAAQQEGLLPDLVEGYSYAGCGIVSVDHYESLHEEGIEALLKRGYSVVFEK